MDPEYVFNKALPYLTGKLEDAGLTVQIGFKKTRARYSSSSTIP